MPSFRTPPPSGLGIHVQHADGEAKFWIDPAVDRAANFSLKPKQITEVQKLIEEHLNEILDVAKLSPAYVLSCNSGATRMQHGQPVRRGPKYLSSVARLPVSCKGCR